MTTIAELRAKDRRLEMEVEDLLALALTRQVSGADLMALSAEMGWDKPSPRAIPFHQWARTVATFIDGGYAALNDAVVRGDVAPSFALGLLEEIPERESAVLACRLGMAALSAGDLPVALKASSTLNLLLSFKHAPVLAADEREQVARFLNDLLSMELEPHAEAVVLCALRGGGNAKSLELLRNRAPLPYPWAGALKAARTALARRR